MFKSFALIGIAALLAAIAPASAQQGPRQTTIVYPFGAGSSADVLARLFAQHLQERLGQTTIVEHAPGAGGMTGSARVARAAPDGSSMLLGGTFNVLNQALYKSSQYNLKTDLTPVAVVVYQPVVLMVRKDLPVTNLAEFTAHARKAQEKMQYGSPGVGSMPHLTCELFNKAIGVKVPTVTFRSAGEIVTELLAGRIDYACLFTSLSIPQIQSKSLSGLAIFSKSRLPLLPDLPTTHEQGVSFDVNPWYGFFMPKDTPAAIVKKYNEAISATLDNPDVQGRLKELGYALVTPEQRSSDYFKRLVESEIDSWTEVVKAAGIQGQ